MKKRDMEPKFARWFFAGLGICGCMFFAGLLHDIPARDPFLIGGDIAGMLIAATGLVLAERRVRPESDSVGAKIAQWPDKRLKALEQYVSKA
ncbi:hypothetical protein [Dyella amyloliquefaciens]|uniref:hypothetical protein n=1 Tax=Dyella amyloliquefaciens TaxID=1770545 RepID=UPI00102E6D96|nr:hypothetical protein [Dyella amyloliquefaciens]